MLLMLSGWMIGSYLREQVLIRRQLESRGELTGEFAVRRLARALATHDGKMLAGLADDMVDGETILRVRLVDEQSVVRLDTSPEALDIRSSSQEELCTGCHRLPAENRPRLISLSERGLGEVVVATPIDNDSECQVCHEQEEKHIGVLLLNFSAVPEQRVAKGEALLQLGISILVTVLLSAFVYLRTNRLVTDRIEALESPLADFAVGDFDMRLEFSPQGDELDNLAQMLNRMAFELESHVEAEKARAELLHTTIITERERIARELHDSIPQLQGYLNTKVGAIQILLDDGHLEQAREEVSQLLAEASQAFNDLREDIIGLRMSRSIENGLVSALEGYARQFEQFCGVPVSFNAEPSALATSIDPQVQVQILRIVQEALSNVRKHARASEVEVHVTAADGAVLAAVSDDGLGFDLQEVTARDGAHFGLVTMQERAEVHGGVLTIVSSPGAGTTVRVWIPMTVEEGHHESADSR